MNRSGPPSWLLGVDLLKRIRTDQLGLYADLQKRHGDIVRLRLGPYRSWLLFHPDQIEPVLTRRSESFVRFEKLTGVLSQWNGESLLMVEGDSWRSRRRKVMRALQSKRMPGYAAAVWDEAERYGAALAAQADGRGRVRLTDADDAFARLTLDIACRTLFGAAPDQAGGAITRAIQDLSETAFLESTAPIVLPDALPLPAKRVKRQAMTTMLTFVADLVEAGLARPPGDDLLAILIAEHGGEPGPIQDDAMSLLIAGHETSGAALSWLFALLAANPAQDAWLREELEAGPDGPMTLERLAASPRLRATVAEALRLYPPAYALFLRRAVEPVELPGVRLRRGDLVQIVPFATQRDARFFRTPEAFRPERHLGEPEWPHYAYLPFGAGPRVCIGASFGLMEVAIVAASLLRRFAIEPAPSLPPARARFSLRPAGGLPMTWRTL